MAGRGGFSDRVVGKFDSWHAIRFDLTKHNPMAKVNGAYRGFPMPSLQLETMGEDEMRMCLRARAKIIAYIEYLRTHLDSGKEEASRFSDQHWHEYEEKAIDHLAVIFALSERDAA